MEKTKFSILKMIDPMTSNQVTIIGISGSPSKNSTGRKALEIALNQAASLGAQTTLIDLREIALPFYDPDLNEPPEEAIQFAQQIKQANAMIWSTPLYHGGLSGLFKNAIDWLELLHQTVPPYLTGIPIGLISTSGGSQGIQAINHMENVVRALRGYTIPWVVPILRASETIQDSRVIEHLKRLGTETFETAHRLRAHSRH